MLLLRNRKRLFSDAEQMIFSTQINPPVLERRTGDALLAQVGFADPFAFFAAWFDDPRLARVGDQVDSIADQAWRG